MNNQAQENIEKQKIAREKLEKNLNFVLICWIIIGFCTVWEWMEDSSTGLILLLVMFLGMGGQYFSMKNKLKKLSNEENPINDQNAVKTNYAKYAIAAPIIFAPPMVFLLTYSVPSSYPQTMGWRIFSAVITFIGAVIWYFLMKKNFLSKQVK